MTMNYSCLDVFEASIDCYMTCSANGECYVYPVVHELTALGSPKTNSLPGITWNKPFVGRDTPQFLRLSPGKGPEGLQAISPKPLAWLDFFDRGGIVASGRFDSRCGARVQKRTSRRAQGRRNTSVVVGRTFDRPHAIGRLWWYLPDRPLTSTDHFRRL